MKNQSPKPLRTERHGRLLLQLLPSVSGCNARKRSRIRCTKAAVHWLCAAARPVPSNPMVAAFADYSAIAGCRKRRVRRQGKGLGWRNTRTE